MKIGILSCIYGRPEVTDIFGHGLARLRDKFGITPLIVGSEGEESKNVAQKHGLLYIEYSNRPLGSKFNAGMVALKSYKPDYVMVLGSDDLISDSFMKVFIREMKKGYDLIGTLDCYFYSPAHKRIGYWDGYSNPRKGETIGMGRTLSKKLLEKCNWIPWVHRLNQGLDGSMMSRINTHKPNVSKICVKTEDIFCLDIKTEGNITAFRCYPNLTKANTNLITKHLPCEAKQILKL